MTNDSTGFFSRAYLNQYIKMKTPKILPVIALVLVATAPVAFADELYSQAANLNGTTYASQNDTNSFGNFATAYDNFALGSDATITSVSFTGKFFNPGSHGNITGFTVNFWADSVGQPGSLLSSNVIGGNGAESFLGNFGGFPAYEYTASVAAFGALAGTQYWISVVPDLGFPPQWGWAVGSGGDNKGYQDFFNARSQLETDFAFTLNGTAGSKVPDSGATVALLGVAFAGLVTLRRRFVR